MSFLNHALELAEKGFYVFPLQAGSKLPAIDDFPNRATRDPERIKRFWLDPVMGFEQPFNIGISTTRFNDNQSLVVVDVDNKKTKKGDEEVLKLELAGYDFIETATQTTPSGGRHLIYRAPEAVKQGANVLANGIDIRSKGGYIVGEGSVIEGKAYTWAKNTAIAECPSWIIERCGRPLEKELPKEGTIKVNDSMAAKRAKEYLATAPVSVEGDAGDETAFKVACKVKDFGVNFDDACELLFTEWNDRCQPPWQPEELIQKVSNAFNYGAKQPGSLAPEKAFDELPVVTETKSSSEEHYLKKINKEYALIIEDGSHVILHETVDAYGRPARKFYKEPTFKRIFSPYTVAQERGQPITQADIWLDWDGRRQYAGLCFTPEQEPKHNYYNLWRGFRYKQTAYEAASPSAKLGFDMFIEHCRDNVCNKEEPLFQWLMGYFAHLVQKPYERPLTTLVFRGQKGVGKNVMIERLGALIGAGHFLTAHNQRYLTSNFNGHMDSCLCLVLDEAFWSGDKSAEGLLKGITTAPEILIERKGKEPYTVQNLVRLVIIGNESWLVPASADERRYAVFTVGSERMQQGEYFEKMRILMDQKGGAEILMHYLKNFDLSKVNVNKAPATQGLADQKLESLSLVENFWHQCLLEGHIHGSELSDWHRDVDKNVFMQALVRYAKERNIRGWIPSGIALGREIKKLSPSTDLNQKAKRDDRYIRVYRFDTLENAREDWSKHLGIEIKWD